MPAFFRHPLVTSPTSRVKGLCLKAGGEPQNRIHSCSMQTLKPGPHTPALSEKHNPKPIAFAGGGLCAAMGLSPKRWQVLETRAGAKRSALREEPAEKPFFTGTTPGKPPPGKA